MKKVDRDKVKEEKFIALLTTKKEINEDLDVIIK